MITHLEAAFVNKALMLSADLTDTELEELSAISSTHEQPVHMGLTEASRVDQRTDGAKLK